MVKRKEFILGAAVGLTFAAAATAGGILDWPSANAQSVQAGRITPSAGAAGMAFAPPQGAPRSFADIFDQVSPAVVQIDVQSRVQRPRGMFQIPGFPFALPVPPGAEPGEGEDGEAEGQLAYGSGSGFFISEDGFIVTNNHVVENAEEITVVLSDERELTARLIGRDEGTDLAVLKVEGGPFPFVSFEEDADPRVGDWVLAVGNPFGLGGTATAGIVSARARDIDQQGYTDFIQIDAAINRGNSGGPTFDIYGRVIGVNTAIFSPTGGSVGVGFAIPADTAKSITERLMRGESIQRGYLGVGIRSLTDEQREALGVPDNLEGAYVESVTPEGPADRAGVEVGDYIVGVNGETVTSSTEVTRRVGAASPGETIRLEVLRGGDRRTLTVRSGTRPSQAELEAEGRGSGGGLTPDAPSATTGTEIGGLRVTLITPALRDRYSIPGNVNGLVVTGVAEGGDQRFQPGYVILRAGNRPAASVDVLRAEVEAARGADRGVFLLVWTPTGTQPTVLELPDAE